MLASRSGRISIAPVRMACWRMNSSTGPAGGLPVCTSATGASAMAPAMRVASATSASLKPRAVRSSSRNVCSDALAEPSALTMASAPSYATRRASSSDRREARSATRNCPAATCWARLATSGLPVRAATASTARCSALSTEPSARAASMAMAISGAWSVVFMLES